MNNWFTKDTKGKTSSKRERKEGRKEGRKGRYVGASTPPLAHVREEQGAKQPRLFE
jgi:hypothetical protein